MKKNRATPSDISVKEFANILDSKIREICKSDNLNYDDNKHRGRALAIYIAQLFIENDDDIETDLDDSLLGDSKDYGIDIHLEDNNNKRIFLIQSKHTGSSKQARAKAIPEDEVKALFSKHDDLMNEEKIQKHANQRAKMKLLSYRDQSVDHQIKFIYVSTGKITERITNLVNEYNNLYSEKNLNIKCEVYDFSELKKLHINIQTSEDVIPSEFKAQIPIDSYIVKETPKKTLLAIIKGNSLVSFYRKYKESLFTRNIRQPLGQQGVNKGIIKTAQEEPDKFFYYNNGISAICTKFHIEKGNLVANDFQVINGAQTVHSLHNSKEDSNIEIIFRLTESKSTASITGFNENIIRYNNTQNKIVESDFKSNDPIQIFLEKELSKIKIKNLPQGINYIRKRGQTSKRKGVINIKLEQLAKIRYSYLYNPYDVLQSAKSLWDDSLGVGKYVKAFGVDGEIIDVMQNKNIKELACAILLWEKIAIFCKKVKKENEDDSILTRFKYHFLNLSKVSINHNAISENKLLDNEDYLSIFLNENLPKMRTVFMQTYLDYRDNKMRSLNAPLRDLTHSKEQFEIIKNKYLEAIKSEHKVYF